VSKIGVLFLSCLAALAACTVPDQLSDVESAMMHGGPVSAAATSPGPASP
jgi:hypothetical protein